LPGNLVRPLGKFETTENTEKGEGEGRLVD
jgi:hypothetical protein